jgi:transposase
MEITMAWTEITRRNYVRRTSGYASDVTDREWDFVAPFMPAPRRLGRPRKTDLRDVLNALLYIASTGCQWRMLPKDFPPCSTVQRYFYEWRAMGLWPRINHHLLMEARELEGKEARIVDTLGLMVGLMVHSADIQDRDGAPDLLKSIKNRWPWLLHVFADGGYAGDKLKKRLQKIGKWTLEIIKRS